MELAPDILGVPIGDFELRVVLTIVGFVSAFSLAENSLCWASVSPPMLSRKSSNSLFFFSDGDCSIWEMGF